MIACANLTLDNNTHAGLLLGLFVCSEKRMQQLPHYYSVQVAAESESALSVSAENLPTLSVAPPLQFGGPGDSWSPEDLLMASVSSCLVLSFRAVARASHFEWCAIQCHSRGELHKVDKLTRFTRVHNKVVLTVRSGTDVARAKTLLEKAERFCLISNTLSADSVLETEVVVQNS